MSKPTNIAIARVVGDLRTTANALSVVLVDDDGATVAASGDASAVPEAIRSRISGRALREAGGLMECRELSPLSRLWRPA